MLPTPTAKTTQLVQGTFPLTVSVHDSPFRSLGYPLTPRMGTSCLSPGIRSTKLVRLIMVGCDIASETICFPRLGKIIASGRILEWRNQPQVAAALIPGQGICRDPRVIALHRSESANFNTSPPGVLFLGAKRRMRQVIYSWRSSGAGELILLSNAELRTGRLFPLATQNGYYGSWGE